LNSNPKPIVTASFSELVAVTSQHEAITDLDLVIQGNLTLESYCTSLLEKVLNLPQNQFSNFLNHQLKLVKDPLGYLNTFEQFIAKNESIFVTNTALSRYHKLFNLIEKQRDLLQCAVPFLSKPTLAKRYINAESEERYFSFYEVKKYTNSLEDDNEKILYLTKEKHDYKQANIEFLNQKLPLFDKQCCKEIEQIYELQKIKSTIDKSKPLQTNETTPFTKLQFNCNVNQFVDMFYQFTREIYVDDKPMIQGNVNDLVTMIVTSFVDKEGNDISALSVKTILKPSREDKRPNTSKRIDINKLFKF
jgi:uncharacterized protein YejL (UPF0352 family)